ncbi:MAG: carboxypeptidase-like regulatory domain-containing protein, partial [Bryobacteraceae bacterium]
MRAPGQVQGTVHGLIQDAGGKPVAAAQVVAHSPHENTGRAAVSATDGSFTLDGLNPGHYQFKAAKRGFADSPVVEA